MMWETIGNWVTKRFSSPIPVLFFLLGAALIVVEAVEIRLPDGTNLLRVNQFGVFMLGLGIALITASALFQIFDRPSPQEQKSRETDLLEIRKYATIREILQAYVNLSGGLDFAACLYKDILYQTTSDEQLSRRLLHYRVRRGAEEQSHYFESLTREVHQLAQIAGERMKTLDQGLLFRTVYDVEKGGMFYTLISDRCYVVSATLDQNSMDDNTADLEMRSLVKTVEQHIARLENQ
ncbi:MAG: hypothetical protein RBS68_00005 [Anaerolineales bacterium]|jgi:hypothetical protein|nr:hypothetical protein [Anaerolineales bacterium]